MFCVAPVEGFASDMDTPSSLIKVVPLPLDAAEPEAPPPAPRPDNQPVLYMEVILDSSGSMAQQLEGRSKMAWAKEAFDAILKRLDQQNVALALRAYGFDTSLPKTPEASCPNTELLTPFEDASRQALSRTVQNLHPYGYTPIADSLRLAGDDLKPHPGKLPRILLISDGEETCGGDPAAVAKALCEQGIAMRVDVVGFDLDAKSRDQLKAVAEAGCGQYFDAKNASGLLEQLQLALDEVEDAVRAAAPERFSNPVDGGGSIATAQTLKPGVYTLKKDLPKGEYRYFFVPARKGEHAVIRSNIQTYGDGRKQGNAVLEAGFSAHVFTANGEPIKGRSALMRKTRGKNLSTGFMDIEGRGFYFAIGDNYVAVHRDAQFELVVEQAGDMYEAMEAGESPDGGSMQLPAGEQFASHLGLEDRADTYHYNATTPAELSIKFTDPSFRFKVETLDAASGKRLARHVKLTGSATVPLPVAPGGLYIKVRDNNPRLYNMFSSYVFSVTPAQ